MRFSDVSDRGVVKADLVSRPIEDSQLKGGRRVSQPVNDAGAERCDRKNPGRSASSDGASEERPPAIRSPASRA